MGAGVLLLVGIVLCVSLLARLMISHFFSQHVFDNNSTMPLIPGFNPDSDTTGDSEESPASPKNNGERIMIESGTQKEG